MDLCYILAAIGLVGLSFLLRWMFQPYFQWRDSIKYFKQSKKTIITKNATFDYDDYFKGSKKSYDLSVVVPAYNEEQRLPIMLSETIEFLEQKNLKYEIIVINDASKDNTTLVALKSSTYKSKFIDLKVVEYPINKGKGGAVRVGMQTAQGQYILMADADAATDIKDFDICFERLNQIKDLNNHGLVTGSRKVIFAKAKRTFLRKILGLISNFIINIICGVKLNDTQCGFKLFTQDTSRLLFKILHLERWAFDVELFIIANHFNIPVDEVPVNWQEIDGSKLNVVADSFRMARDFIMVRFLYVFGIWKYNQVIEINKQN